MKEFETIVISAYWILLSILVITIIGRYIYFVKTKVKRIQITEEKIVFRIFRYATFIVLPIFIFSLVNFIFILQKGNMFALSWMKTTLLAFLFILLASELYYNTKIIQRNINRIFHIGFLLIVSTIGIYLTALYFKAISHPTKEKSVTIELPFKGKWIATGAGATGLTNHHDRLRSQKYAVDISRLGDNDKLFKGEGIEKEESHTFGAKIFSPVDGEVVYVVNDLPDTPTRERDKLAGNHIVIRFQDSLFVALAHLKKGSVVVKEGDVVEVGKLLAEVGLSGNTDFSHLHIHIQDRPIYDIENGITYPVRFKAFKRKRYLFWNNIENEFLLSNDVISN